MQKHNHLKTKDRPNSELIKEEMFHRQGLGLSMHLAVAAQCV
jgi:hypothetical protein